MKRFTLKRSTKQRLPSFDNPDNIAFVIGNGTTRKGKDLEALKEHGMLVGCNYFYRDMMPHVLVLSDEGITNTVAKVSKEWCRKNHVFSWYDKKGGVIKKVSFPEKTSAGLMAVYESIVTFGAKEIFLVGMDFFGLGSSGKDSNGKINNLYVGQKHYAKDADFPAPTYRNWQRRFQYVLQQFPDVQFYHVNPLDGRSPERLIGAPNFHQVSYEDMEAYLKDDVDLVDRKEIDESDVALFEEENPDNMRATLERQFTNQENYIYPDKIHPEDFIKLRLQAQQVFRSNQQAMQGSMITMRIKEFDVGVGPMIVSDKAGRPVLATDEQVIALTQRDLNDRYGRLGIKLEPFRSVAPKGLEQQQPLAPPPPSFADLPVPPPPPPI